MEGVAGVTAWEQVDARTPSAEYPQYQRYYTQEVAAAIAGAKAAGATEILVNDSHGPMRNLLLDELPADIRVIFGNRKPYSMVQDADASFAGALFVGYHGGIGDRDAVLCHTYTPSVIDEARLNGTVCTEATLNAALLGHHGVPLLYVSGDRTTVTGVQSQMPWVLGTVVKDSIGNFSANSISPRAAQAAIEADVRAAVTARANAKPYRLASPLTLDIDLAKVEQADHVTIIPGFERTGQRSVRFVHTDMQVVFKAFVATFRMAS
jgi:D-amino peptidase